MSVQGKSKHTCLQKSAFVTTRKDDAVEIQDLVLTLSHYLPFSLRPPMESFFFSFFLAVLGCKLRESCLLGRHSTTSATLLALFCVGYFQDKA
jgi:hypothetical protein